MRQHPERPAEEEAIPTRTVSLSPRFGMVLPFFTLINSFKCLYSLLLSASRTSLISRRYPSGSWKKARVSLLQSKGGVRNSAPRERRTRVGRTSSQEPECGVSLMTLLRSGGGSVAAG